RRCISTSAIISIISGFLLMVLGTSLARPILEAMSAPADVIDLATLYLRIYFCGMPFIMIYNFGSAIMRSVGDTRLPFYSLLIATLCNLLLDWVFVALFDWGVAGVAWATVIANGINAAIIVYFLTREHDPITLVFTGWKFSRPDFSNMLRIGIPAGLQGMVFSISNIFIQSAINQFGSDAIAGSAAALTYEAYCYYIVAAFTAATIAFTGQNYGASKPERCKRVVCICLLYSVVLCGLANLLVVWQERACMSVFTTDPEVIRYAFIRFHTVLIFQSIASSYEIFGAYMRGLGYSLTPMLLTIFGTCILRLAWVYSLHGTQYSFGRLLAIYPISWAITGLTVIAAALWVQRRVFARMTNTAYD
ncbi:MAG: MATE family efflux transporter, partial [Muribaculaceae bacterium]|nr:MATE family efflux transporter [Muribaculaceae bacterium]